MSSDDTLEIRRLQEAADGTYKLVLLNGPSVASVRACHNMFHQPHVEPTLHKFSSSRRNSQRRLEVKPTLTTRTVLEAALLSELKNKLKPQKSRVDEQIEARRLSRLKRLAESLKTPKETNLTAKVIVSDRRPIMDELKQRLNRISVSSKFDIDRIVKETKTTTITESKETIHFRPEKEKLIKVAHPDAPRSNRLSIRCSPETSPQPSEQSEPSYTYVNITELGESKPKKLPISGDNKGTLVNEFVPLERDIKDINLKNKDLRERFFKNTKVETPILRSNSDTHRLSHSPKPTLIKTDVNLLTTRRSRLSSTK